MGRQLNIRSDRAYELATRLASERGEPIARVIEAALESLAQADAEKRQSEIQAKLREWDEMLEEVRKHFIKGEEFKIEDLYDPETGLPA